MEEEFWHAQFTVPWKTWSRVVSLAMRLSGDQKPELLVANIMDLETMSWDQ